MGSQGLAAARAKAADATSVRGILDAVRRLTRALRLSHEDARRKVGLSAAQVFVLQSLREHPAKSLGELAARTATDPSSVSVVAAHLARIGLVSTQVDAADKRRRELHLTPKGRQMLRKAPVRVAQHSLIDAIESLPAKDRKALEALLGRVVHAMGVGTEVPKMFFEERGPRGRRRKRS
jgi:DNA-binding MarR family transcriptional regulator